MRQLCHCTLRLLKADGDENEPTGTDCNVGSPQDPRQHEDEK